MISDARINVWAGLNSEAHLDRISKQAADAIEIAERVKRYVIQLKTRAQRGDRSAERALAVLVDGQYEAYAEAKMEDDQ